MGRRRVDALRVRPNDPDSPVLRGEGLLGSPRTRIGHRLCDAQSGLGDYPAQSDRRKQPAPLRFVPSATHREKSLRSCNLPVVYLQ